MGRMRETEKNATFPTSVGHIYEEQRDIHICKIETAHAQLPVDFIKHAVARFALFLALFLLVLNISCFQDINPIHAGLFW